MFSLTKLSYKKKLVSIYVGITLLGIALTLIAIYNASREQRVLDQINNMHSIFHDRLTGINYTLTTPEQLALDLTTNQYKAVLLHPLNEQQLRLGECTIKLLKSTLDQQRMNIHGGMTGEKNCLFSWVLLDMNNPEYFLLILHQHNNDQKNSSIIAAYTNRLTIPLVFFTWMTIWGSLMLGNLVNRLQLQKNEVERMAMHDNLTGLPNRKYFSEKIHELIKSSSQTNTPFVLAMVDLNKFKNVNDELGHHYGDLLLQQVALRFKKGIRDIDMAARLGGDEFLLLLMGSDIDSSMQILESVYQSIINEYQVLDNTVKIGASIGISSFPDHDTSYSELLHKADIAMYMAKDSGGGIRSYKPSEHA
ncbi:MAG: GGDEF domain-containing protein [Gammaproteobacteria bacterium]